MSDFCPGCGQRTAAEHPDCVARLQNDEQLLERLGEAIRELVEAEVEQAFHDYACCGCHDTTSDEQHALDAILVEVRKRLTPSLGIHVWAATGSLFEEPRAIRIRPSRCVICGVPRLFAEGTDCPGYVRGKGGAK